MTPAMSSPLGPRQREANAETAPFQKLQQPGAALLPVWSALRIGPVVVGLSAPRVARAK
jgi:hypothetical protein